MSDAGGRPHIDFCRSRTIHFARFAILDDPDRGPDRKRLLFSSNYDGDLDGHLAELVAITSDMDAIWGRLRRLYGRGRVSRRSSARTRTSPTPSTSRFRDETVERIQQSIALRRQRAAPARRGVSRVACGASTAPVRGRAGLGGTSAARSARPCEHRVAIERLMRALPIVADLPRALARCGFTTSSGHACGSPPASTDIRVFRLFNWITGNRLPPQKSVVQQRRGRQLRRPWCRSCRATRSRRARTGIPPTFREDVVTQNQLTLVTVVEPEQVDRVRAVMAAIDSFAKRLAPPGSLIGISTIHFVRWLLIDDGRRL